MSPFWVSNAETGVATVYDGHGRAFPMDGPLVVTIPQAPGKTGPAAPTGQVFNGTGAFAAAPGMPAVFLFATEDGTIAGWNPGVDRTHAVLKVDRSASGAIYKGLAIAAGVGGPRIYATNFHAGTVDVFDGNFNPALAGAFADPSLPAGYAPFNIRNVNGRLFVTYAKQDADAEDDVPGPGNGYVNEFDLDGVLIRRFASQGTLNAPWGIALAPAGFGAFGGQLLIGNFGDGRISAFDPETGEFRGQLEDGKGRAIEIEGLWAILFGNGANAGDTDKLYFTAGIEEESHGLFGQIRARHGGEEAEGDQAE
jgi:uncharacterized protein (TIGR03118 family)